MSLVVLRPSAGARGLELRRVRAGHVDGRRDGGSREALGGLGGDEQQAARRDRELKPMIVLTFFSNFFSNFWLIFGKL